jgi:hypothetical protein
MTLIEAIRKQIKVKLPDGIKGMYLDCTGDVIKWSDGKLLSHNIKDTLFSGYVEHVEEVPLEYTISIPCSVHDIDKLCVSKGLNGQIELSVNAMTSVILDDTGMTRLLDFIESHGNSRICPF